MFRHLNLKFKNYQNILEQIFEFSFNPYLEIDKSQTYQLMVPTFDAAGSGFYFYTGTNIFGSGKNPYTGTAITSTNFSGVLINPITQQITGYKTNISMKVFTISAGHLPDNLYYGNLYSANAGNNVITLTPNTNINKCMCTHTHTQKYVYVYTHINEFH